MVARMAGSGGFRRIRRPGGIQLRTHTARPAAPRRTPRRRRLVRVVDYYIFAEALQLYAIGFGGFLAFLVINQLFLEGDRLLNPNFPAREILRLIGLSVPYFVTMAIPVAVLFGTMMSMGRLAKDNEIDAMFTNGIHLYRLVMPFVVLSLFNVGIVFAVNELLVPKANAVAEQVYQKYPYLRVMGEAEVDPTIVRLPNGAFFASSFVDKNTGTSFYAVYDTLTMPQAEAVEGPAPMGPDNPPPAAAPPTAGPAPGTPPTPPRPEGAPARPGTGGGSTVVAPGAAPRAPTTSAAPPAGRIRSAELPPREMTNAAGASAAQAVSAGSADSMPASAQSGEVALDPARLPKPQPDRKLYLAANAQISEENLGTTQPFIYEIGPDGLIGRREQRSFATLRLGIPLKDVFTDIKTPEELSREELQRQTEVKRQLGVNPAKDATDFYLKFSIPFACLFLSLVAMPLSLRAPREERLLGLVITFILVMSYYTIYYMGKLMGYNEILPPVIAAWLQNLVYAVVAMFIFAFSRK